MGFNSDDDLINSITVDGKFKSIEYFKSTSPVHTAGGWHMLVGLNGYPNAGTFPGTDLLWANCAETSGDGTTVIGPQHNGIVTPDTKHVINIGAMMVAAAGAPWMAKLVDVQGYYRLSGTNVTGTGSRTLINTNTFTADAGTDLITYTNDFKTLTKVRLTTTGTLPAGLSLATDYWLSRASATTAKICSSLANAIADTGIDITSTGSGTHTLTIQMPRATSGVGCEACFVVQTAPTGGGPNLSASSYTNTAGTAGRAFQGSPTCGAAADAYATRIIHSGNASGRYGPFLPRQGSDTGIASIESFTLSGGTAYTGSGVLALCVVKPLGVDLCLPATGVFSERDLKNQLPSLPRVEDGACLAWMLFGTGATTNASPFTSRVDVGWS